MATLTSAKTNLTNLKTSLPILLISFSTILMVSTLIIPVTVFGFIGMQDFLYFTTSGIRVDYFNPVFEPLLTGMRDKAVSDTGLFTSILIALTFLFLIGSIGAYLTNYHKTFRGNTIRISTWSRIVSSLVVILAQLGLIYQYWQFEEHREGFLIPLSETMSVTVTVNQGLSFYLLLLSAIIMAGVFIFSLATANSTKQN